MWDDGAEGHYTPESAGHKNDEAISSSKLHGCSSVKFEMFS